MTDPETQLAIKGLGDLLSDLFQRIKALEAKATPQAGINLPSIPDVCAVKKLTPDFARCTLLYPPPLPGFSNVVAAPMPKEAQP